MSDNLIKYKGELVNGEVILTSVQYPSEFKNESGEVIMTCEPVAYLISENGK